MRIFWGKLRRQFLLAFRPGYIRALRSIDQTTERYRTAMDMLIT